MFPPPIRMYHSIPWTKRTYARLTHHLGKDGYARVRQSVDREGRDRHPVRISLAMSAQDVVTLLDGGVFRPEDITVCGKAGLYLRRFRDMKPHELKKWVAHHITGLYGPYEKHVTVMRSDEDDYGRVMKYGFELDPGYVEQWVRWRAEADASFVQKFNA